MMKDGYQLPHPVIQAVGLTCVPLPEIGSDMPLGRKPVTAAVLTLSQREDGHVDVIATRLSDARDLEFPLPYLVDQALMPGALTIVSAADRAALGVEAAARRFFVEPRLVRMVTGTRVVDPLASPPFDGVDEASACRRLGIPVDRTSDADIGRLWSRHAPEPVETIALARAVSRLMLWSSIEAFTLADPGPFFETMLPLRTWMNTQADAAPAIYGWATCRPMMHAVSFAGQYRGHRRRVVTGDSDTSWVSFEDNLLHT
jgi:hypothetical protein